MTAQRGETRALATLSVLGVLPWLLFHLWEQWSALAGRDAWLARMESTSGGSGGRLVEIVVVLGLVALAVLTGRALARGGPLPGHALDGSERPLVRALATVSKPALVGTLLFLVVHAAWLWLPHALGRASLAEGYEALRVAAGTPLLLVVHAIGLSAVAMHVAASLPAWLVTNGVVETSEGRRSASLVGAGLAACLLVLSVQLYGWHATGTGTVWPIQIVDVAEPASDALPDEP